VRSLIILVAGCGLIAQVHLPGTSGNKSSGGGSKSQASDTNQAHETTGESGTNKAPGQAKSDASSAQEPDGYVLELAWAPTSRTRFVVSGFGPQLQDGSIPESCAKPKKLPGSVTKLATLYMRTAADAQREWNVHGSCSGLDPDAYFTRMIRARVAVQLPVQLTSLEGEATASGEEIESYFVGANTTLPPKAFQARCVNGIFAGVRVSFDRSLNPRERRGAVSGCGTNARITLQSAQP